jgi:hypothetical protein
VDLVPGRTISDRKSSTLGGARVRGAHPEILTVYPFDIEAEILLVPLKRVRVFSQGCVVDIFKYPGKEDGS